MLAHRHRIVRLSALVVVFVSWRAHVASAAPADARAPPVAPVPASAVTLSEDGITLYEGSRYRPALEKFLQSYAIEPDPNLLFNIARCYQALGDTRAALQNYRAFVAAPAADLSARSRAHAAIEALSLLPAPALSPPGPAEGAPAPVDTGRGQLIAAWVATGLLTGATVVTGVVALDSADTLRRERATFPGDAAELARRASQTTTLTVSADVLGLASLSMAGLSTYWTVVRRSAGARVSAGIAHDGLLITGSF